MFSTAPSVVSLYACYNSFAAAKPLRRRGRRSGRGRAVRSIPTVDAAFPSVLPGGNAESEAACRKVSGLCASVG